MGTFLDEVILTLIKKFKADPETGRNGFD